MPNTRKKTIDENQSRPTTSRTTSTNATTLSNSSYGSNKSNKSTSSTAKTKKHKTTLKKSRKKKQIILFDLDETIGYFTQIGILYDMIEEFTNRKMTFRESYQLLDTFPEVFRPNIFNIFRMLVERKKQNPSLIIAIYTNNQAPLSWANMIKNYIHYKLEYPLFNTVIGSYKVGNKIQETRRTTNEKVVDDIYSIFNCKAKMCQILFFDDQFHEKMTPKQQDEKIYYLHIKPYTYDYPTNELITKYIYSLTSINHIYKTKQQQKFKIFSQQRMKEYRYTPKKIHRTTDDYETTDEMKKAIDYFFTVTSK